jgi:uncharacterized membrane protein
MKTFISDLSKKEFPATEKIHGNSIRSSLFQLIVNEHPEFTVENSLALSELNYYREKYISSFVNQQLGELTITEQTVLDSLTDRTTLSDKVADNDNQVLTFGQRIADKVATFGGSWTFIISFGIFLFSWIALNMLWLMNKGFDPYPFILLNLILSTLAALQAPVIMMSQNRQEEKDRERAKKDYMINLKSELEIRILHEKIDHFMLHQTQELLELQKVQIEMMNDMMKEIAKN